MNQETEMKFKLALAAHWVLEMRCNHEKKTDQVFCACGATCEERPSVGEAALSWAAHVLSAVQPAPGLLDGIAREGKDEIFVNSIVSNKTGEGFVQVMWNGKAGQLTVTEAKQLGMQFLVCAEAAESDAGVVHVLMNKIGTTFDVAMGILTHIREYREERFKKILKF